MTVTSSRGRLAVLIGVLSLAAIAWGGMAQDPPTSLPAPPDWTTEDDHRDMMRQLGITMPPVNAGLLEGRLAWRQHDGGHTDGPNWSHFIPWASRELGL